MLVRFVLSKVVLLHLLEEFRVLCFCYFFVSDAHVGVVGCDPAHGHVGNVVESHLILIDLELFLPEEIQIQQLSTFLPVVTLEVHPLLLLNIHFLLLADSVLQNLS